MSSDRSQKQTEPNIETLLVVDDDPKVHPLIDFHLDGVVDRILHAESPRAGLQIAKQATPDVMLLDIDMPQMDGYAVCRELKKDELTRDIQILFLTAANCEHEIARALDIGGSDYVTKPFSSVVLQARVRLALRMKRLIDLLKREARVDGLTGLPNRRVFEEALEIHLSECLRRSQSFAVAILDLDHFKAINDGHGHGVGDEVLRLVGQTMQSSKRAYDVICRFGGEEFAMLLRGVDEKSATGTVQRILTAIRNIHLPAKDQGVRITASAGIAYMSPANAAIGAAALLEIADAALYRAKAKGRDCLVSVAVDDE